MGAHINFAMGAILDRYANALSRDVAPPPIFVLRRCYVLEECNIADSVNFSQFACAQQFVTSLIIFMIFTWILHRPVARGGIRGQCAQIFLVPHKFCCAQKTLF